MEDSVPQGMRLYAGDVVTVQLASAENESHPGLIVDDRGMLHLPLAGDVQVAGMPLADAERACEQALRAYDRSIRVSIIITTADGHRATVTGAVTTPGRIAVTPGTRVADLIAAAGGVARDVNTAAPNGDIAGARLVRDGNTLPISIARAAQGDPRHNIRVLPGDQLFVPSSRESAVAVIGAVQSPRVVAFSEGLTLTQAIALAGGLERFAEGNDVRIVRGHDDTPLVYQASLNHIVNGARPDVFLASGDVIHVANSSGGDLGWSLDQVSPIISTVTSIGLVTLTAVLASGR